MADQMISVVVADDVVDLRELVRLVLELDGRFTVVGEAGDGAQAVVITEQEQPDLVILDLSMPVMDGLAAIPEIHRVSPDSRVAVLSGLEESAMRDKVLSLSAEDYIEKGFPTSDLAGRLVKLLVSPRKSVAS